MRKSAVLISVIVAAPIFSLLAACASEAQRNASRIAREFQETGSAKINCIDYRRQKTPRLGDPTIVEKGSETSVERMQELVSFGQHAVVYCLVVGSTPDQHPGLLMEAPNLTMHSRVGTGPLDAVASGFGKSTGWVSYGPNVLTSFPTNETAYSSFRTTYSEFLFLERDPEGARAQRAGCSLLLRDYTGYRAYLPDVLAPTNPLSAEWALQDLESAYRGADRAAAREEYLAVPSDIRAALIEARNTKDNRAWFFDANVVNGSNSESKTGVGASLSWVCALHRGPIDRLALRPFFEFGNIYTTDPSELSSRGSYRPVLPP